MKECGYINTKNVSYVVFGTGSGGQKAYDFLKDYPDIQVECFLDNFPKTDEFCALPVIKAGDYLQSDKFDKTIYIIASSYREEIMKQLLECGVAQKNIWSRIDVVCNYWNTVWNKLCIPDVIVCDKETTSVLDLGNGFVLGGVERWSYNLAREMLKNNQSILLLSNHSKEQPPKDLLQYSAWTKNTEDFTDFDMCSVQEIMDLISEHLPCVVYTAHIDNLLLAAYALKQHYPQDVKIISVIHGGLQKIIYDNVIVADMVDALFCVSIDTQKVLLQKYNINENKVFFKETPTELVELKERYYASDASQPLRIAYATRLEKVHKHAELLVPFVEELEQQQISYQLDVAGDGVLYEYIQEFVVGNNLQDKVHLLGRVPYERMQEFWLEHDIAINLSECEGCAMTMVESMAAGTVPIFTDVFSTRHFIQDGENGFVTDYGNIPQMVEKIKYLQEHREMLSQMGHTAYDGIRSKCCMTDYYEYIREKIIGGK